MSYGNENPPSFPIDQRDGLVMGPASVAPGEEAKPSLAADRLYQLAAVTAGFFLLATLL
jgi:hypothetical protein